MRKTLVQPPVRWAVTTVVLATLATTANAGSFTRGCAARDMQILMLIEGRETADAGPTDKLHEAMLKMMHARILCHEGHVLDALAIYDSIAESITPGPVHFGERVQRKSNEMTVGCKPWSVARIPTSEMNLSKHYRSDSSTNSAASSLS
jgi:hypothetical protein